MPSLPPPPPPLAAGTDLDQVRGLGGTAVVVDEWRRQLAEALALGSPNTWPGFAVVKQSAVRSVRCGALADGTAVHVKLYRASCWTDHARDLLQGSRASVEFTNLRRARALGLPAVEPIAHGVATDGRSFLVTRTVDGAPLLRNGWPTATAAAAGTLLARTHAAGLEAFDLHPENVLRDGSGHLWLADLTSVRFAAALELRARAHALAFFLLDLDGGPRHPHAAPLLAAYGASERLRTETASAWRRLRTRALAAFGRRATRACRHTAVTAVAGATVFRHLPAGALAEEAVGLEATLTTATAAKSGRRGAVWLFERVAAKRRARARARHLFRAAYWLRFAGVPCPRPLALVLRHDAGVVLTERMSGVALTAAEVHDLPAASLRIAAHALGDAVGRLHAHGLRNRDLKFENLVLHPQTLTVAMVDLDGVRRRSPADTRRLAADLGRLLASFRTAGAPGGTRALSAFVRGYTRARQCLGQDRPSPRARRFQQRRIEENARRHARPGATTRSASG